jgi:hypothetical protein
LLGTQFVYLPETGLIKALYIVCIFPRVMLLLYPFPELGKKQRFHLFSNADWRDEIDNITRIVPCSSTFVTLTLKVKATMMTKYGSNRPFVCTNRALFGSVCNLVATTVAKPGSWNDFGSAV